MKFTENQFGKGNLYFRFRGIYYLTVTLEVKNYELTKSEIAENSEITFNYARSFNFCFR